MKQAFVSLCFTVVCIGTASAQTQTKTYAISNGGTSGKWEYQEIVDVPNVPAAELFTRIRSGYIKNHNDIQFEEPPVKLVIRYQVAMGGFKYGKVTETFEIKDGKVRWTMSDFAVLFMATAISTWKNLEDTNDRSAVRWWNEFLPKNRRYLLEKLTVAGEQKSGW